jgi:RHS repeat-associated protein
LTSLTAKRTSFALVTTYDLIRNTNFQTIYSYSPIYDNWQPNAETGAQPEIPVESSVAYYDTTGTLLKTVAKGWQNERLLAAQQTTYPNGQTSKTTWTYNSNEMETEHDDYDFPTASSFLRATVTSYATSTNMATYHVIDKPASVIVYSDSAKTNRVAETDYTYDIPLGTTTSGIVQHLANCNCGNLTKQSQWLNTTGTTLNTTFTNDDTGQRLSMTDPRGNQTTYSYTDSFSSGTPPGPTNAYLTTVTHPQTSGVNHIEKFAYAYASGEVTSSTDQNNLVTNYKYVDNLARLTETDSPDGGVTSVSYNDSAYNPSTPSPSVTTTKKINGTTNLVAVSAMDGLGHVLNKLVTSDPQGTIHVDTAYDGLGRVYTVSNPYRSGTDPTTSSGTTTYIYDALGRKCVEIPQDGTAVSSNTCPTSAPAKDLFTLYLGPTTTVTDQTGKKRQSTTDGLSRLTQVVEDPGGLGYITNYTTDTLGNLKQIVQNGSHTRTFTYDSLSRLLCSSNPENSFAACPTSATTAYTPGTVGYAYDADSNVATKTVSTSQSSGTPGSGSATVNGSEQSLAGAPAVSGTGSVTFSGALQSKQVLTTQATHSTGTVNVLGHEQSGNFCDDSGRNCHFKYDTGTVTVTVNGVAYTVSYGQTDTSNTVAANLASSLNAGSLVTATVSASAITLTSVATGTAANYSLSGSSFTNDPTDFGSPSFNPIPTSSTLTGGANAVYSTRYDSGTSTITVNGHADTVSWSGSATTTSSIASSLATAINADSGAYVSASASGAVVNLTAKTAGASTNYSLSSSYTFDSTDFSSSSFTSSNSGGALTGGRDAGATVYDTGSVWITLNGTQYSVSYGQTSTTSSLASTLASAISAGSLANATANGAVISITAKTVGLATNYSLSYGSSTSQPGSFSSPSFSISTSGGSLTGGTDPGTPVVTAYSYDALNRETVRTYSNGDPTVTTTYDQSACLVLSACQNIGHATSITDGAGSESWAYQVDPANLRSAHVNQRTTTSSPSNITKTSTYYFDLASNLTSITYPTGRIVNYTYDAANRPATAVDSANGITYAAAQVSPPTGCLTTGVCYTPQGAEYSATVGKTSTFNGVNLSETYNSRLQPLEIKASSSAGNAFDITYSFVDPSSGGNAGHVNSITNNLDTTRSQTFTYDSLNRITGALTTSTHATSPAHCWGEIYTLDAWGNLNSIAATTNSSYTGCSEESGFSATADGNNHLPIFSYDQSGNTLSDGSIAYTYNAESQIKTAAGVTYLYDGSGRRVSKSSGKLYWYGSGGEILAETTATGATLNEYIFFAGKRVAMLPAGGNAEYYAEDLLGSSRVTTTNNGTVCYDADFYPYGGERAYTNSCPSANVYKFEGKERDTETGNDDFGARYYSNRFGRWLSADWSNVPVPVPYANLTNPQTLNLYAMVSDDPESSADLDGHQQQQSQGLNESGCAAAGGGSSANGSCARQPNGTVCNTTGTTCTTSKTETLAIGGTTLVLRNWTTTTTTSSDGQTKTTTETYTQSTFSSETGKLISSTQNSQMFGQKDGGPPVLLGSYSGLSLSREAARDAIGYYAFDQAQAAAAPGAFKSYLIDHKSGLHGLLLDIALAFTPAPEARWAAKAKEVVEKALLVRTAHELIP